MTSRMERRLATAITGRLMPEAGQPVTITYAAGAMAGQSEVVSMIVETTPVEMDSGGLRARSGSAVTIRYPAPGHPGCPAQMPAEGDRIEVDGGAYVMEAPESGPITVSAHLKQPGGDHAGWGPGT